MTIFEYTLYICWYSYDIYYIDVHSDLPTVRTVSQHDCVCVVSWNSSFIFSIRYTCTDADPSIDRHV
jgi:hypothetical protein